MGNEEVPCKEHPGAPHGFLRGLSHSQGRYVCECEHWEPEQLELDLDEPNNGTHIPTNGIGGDDDS